MKKVVYRVLGFRPPEVESVAVNYWVSAGSSKKELPTGFDPKDIAAYANKELEVGDVLDSGLVILKVTATVPADVVLKKTVMNNG